MPVSRSGGSTPARARPRPGPARATSQEKRCYDSIVTRLLLGTSSEKKIAELKEIFAGLPVTVVTPSELGLTLDPEETGSTFEQNARLKARAFAQAAGIA